MKRQFITQYVLADEKYEDMQIWGTCPKWVKEAQRSGYKLVGKRKILWVGTPPPCSACSYGGHAVL